MAPAPHRKLVTKDQFAALFPRLKTQSYYDPASRGPGSHGIRTIAWSPLGNLIATGAIDKTLRVWNPEKADVKYSTELRGHTAAIEEVAWNPVKEAELASVSLDGTVRFWDVRTKTCLATVQLGSDGLSLAWAHDGRLLMAGSRKDETLTPIAVPSFTTLPSVPQHTQTNRLIFAPTQPEASTYVLLIAQGSGQVKFTRYPKPPISTPLPTSPETSLPSAPAPSLEDLAAIYPTDLPILKTIPGHPSSCTCLRLAPNGRWLGTGGSDAMLHLWDTSELCCIRGLDRPQGSVRSLSFSWDGHFVCCGTDEGSGIDVAHTETGEYVARLETKETVGVVAWHPHRYWLAYAGEPGLRVVGAAGGSF